MPYLVPVEIRESAIHGKGVFALQDIPKGTVCWVAQCDNPIPVVACQGCVIKENVNYTREQIKNLPKKERSKILHYCSYNTFDELICDLWDGGGFVNHSQNPTTKVIYPVQSKKYGETKSIAIRDVKKGQELTQNYNDYPLQYPAWLFQMLDEDQPDRSNLQKSFLIPNQHKQHKQ